jgi:hypothetical protein
LTGHFILVQALDRLWERKGATIYFVFVNPVRFGTAPNPDFFKGTIVEGGGQAPPLDRWRPA